MNNRSHWLLAALVFVCGCGSGRPSLVQVTGKVTLDGKPLEGAQVAFQPLDTEPEFQRPSSAITNASGEFSPQTYVEGDGLRVGKYRVAVVKTELVGTPPAGMDLEQAQQARRKRKWITPKAVATPEKSGIEVEVTSSGMQPDVIALKSVTPAEVE